MTNLGWHYYSKIGRGTKRSGSRTLVLGVLGKNNVFGETFGVFCEDFFT